MASCASSDSRPPRVSDDHRRLGFVLLLGEQRLLRHHQVDSHPFDVAQGGERALQFAFECALVIYLLREVRSRPVGGIKKFEAHARAARQACRRRLEPRGIELIVGHQQAAAIGRDLVRNIFRRQLRPQRLRILRPQAGIERHIFRLAQQRHEYPQCSRDQHHPGRHPQALGEAQPFQKLLQPGKDIFERLRFVVGHRFACHTEKLLLKWNAAYADLPSELHVFLSYMSFRTKYLQNCMREIS